MNSATAWARVLEFVCVFGPDSIDRFLHDGHAVHRQNCSAHEIKDLRSA